MGVLGRGPLSYAYVSLGQKKINVYYFVSFCSCGETVSQLLLCCSRPRRASFRSVEAILFVALDSTAIGIRQTGDWLATPRRSVDYGVRMQYCISAGKDCRSVLWLRVIIRSLRLCVVCRLCQPAGNKCDSARNPVWHAEGSMDIGATPRHQNLTLGSHMSGQRRKQVFRTSLLIRTAKNVINARGLSFKTGQAYVVSVVS